MRKIVLYTALGLLSVCLAGAPAQSAGFTLCRSTYALCTTAPCTPAGKDGALSCSCEVRTGYSAGQEACQDLRKASDSTQLRSRYYPVKSYAVCTNDRPWAWCLDKPCTIDKVDPTKARCACTTAKGQGPYVIVGDTDTPATCTTGTISSATVKGITEITDFLKTTSELKPFPIEVLKSSEPEQRSEIPSRAAKPE
jgi:hypothetical protein